MGKGLGGWVNGGMDGWVGGCVDGWRDGWMGGCVDGLMDGWEDGRRCMRMVSIHSPSHTQLISVPVMELLSL